MVSLVTGHADMDPCPRAKVDIDAAELDLGTDAVTVWQLTPQAEYPVRSAVKVASAGGVVVTDYEVPLGVPVTYRVEQFTAGTSIGFSDIELTVQVDVSPRMVVVQDPLSPADSVMVNAEMGFSASLARSRPTKVYRAGDRSVALSGLRGLLRDVPLRCFTDGVDGEVLDRVLAATQILVRTMPVFPIPRVLHAVVPDVVRLPFDYHNGGSTDVWDLSGQEVSRSEVDILVPVINYQLFASAFATYGDAAAAYSSYLDALRDPPSAA